MSRLIPALSAALVAVSCLTAQNVVIPSAAATVDAGTSQNMWREVALRYMSIYDSTNFTAQNVGQPIVINTVEWRMGATLIGTACTYPSVEIYIEPSATDYLTPSTTYQTNRTLPRPRTPEYAGPVTLNVGAGTTPNSYSVSVTLQNPVTYSPDAGQDLIVEMVILAAPTPAVISTIASSSSVAAHKAQGIRTIGNTVNLTGSLSAFTPAVRLGYTDAPNAGKSEPYGVGCYTRARSYYEQFPGSGNDLGGKTVTMAQNLNGGYDVNTTVGASLVAPSGLPLALGDDVVSTAIALPFTFDYPGGSTTQIFVDSNGSVLLNGTAGSNIGGSGAVFMASTVHRLSPSLQDFDPSVGGGVFAEVDPLYPTQIFLITWQAVPCFAGAGTSTFQVALIDNGTNDTAEFRYTSLTNNSTSNGGIAVTGFTLGAPGVNPGSSDLTAGPISTTSTERLPLALAVAPRPIINTSITFTTSNVPAPGASLLFLSSGQLNPGVDLGVINMPGCNANVVLPEFQSFLNIGVGTVTNIVPVPNDPLLIGAIVFAQSGAIDPPANAFGAISSNGVKLTVGSL